MNRSRTGEFSLRSDAGRSLLLRVITRSNMNTQTWNIFLDSAWHPSMCTSMTPCRQELLTADSAPLHGHYLTKCNVDWRNLLPPKHQHILHSETTPDIFILYDWHMSTWCACGEGFTENLFEVGDGKQLLDPGQEVGHERLESRVKTLVEHLLKQTEKTKSVRETNCLLHCCVMKLLLLLRWPAGGAVCPPDSESVCQSESTEQNNIHQPLHPTAERTQEQEQEYVHQKNALRGTCDLVIEIIQTVRHRLINYHISSSGLQLTLISLSINLLVTLLINRLRI